MKRLHASTMINDIPISVKAALLALFGALLISLSAHIPLQLPLIDTPIPGTWQTFAVLVFAYVTSIFIAIGAVTLYLVGGILGLPIFADGASGISVLMGNTGGYLYGFIVGASAASLFGKLYCERRFIQGLIAMTAGTSLILLCGVVHLAFSIGLTNALNYGLYPFVYGALIKIVLGAAVFPLYRVVKQGAKKV